MAKDEPTMVYIYCIRNLLKIGEILQEWYFDSQVFNKPPSLDLKSLHTPSSLLAPELNKIPGALLVYNNYY